MKKENKLLKTIRQNDERFDEKIENEFLYLKKSDNSYHLAAKTVAKEEGKIYFTQSRIKELEALVEMMKEYPIKDSQIGAFYDIIRILKNTIKELKN